MISDNARADIFMFLGGISQYMKPSISSLIKVLEKKGIKDKDCIKCTFGHSHGRPRVDGT